MKIWPIIPINLILENNSDNFHSCAVYHVGKSFLLHITEALKKKIFSSSIIRMSCIKAVVNRRE